jgi:hypothetical protein
LLLLEEYLFSIADSKTVRSMDKRFWRKKKSKIAQPQTELPGRKEKRDEILQKYTFTACRYIETGIGTQIALLLQKVNVRNMRVAFDWNLKTYAAPHRICWRKPFRCKWITISDSRY